uniref:E3 ubiquitin-protein ligase TRIM56-like n=1 Tax=Saccoglossus kowalevskii TaxID=10224 RepID=A0ABM0M3M1_SACKO|nr:PREDICTED: E3 ubiquitin-protein ligase TRIM56-like [Saccoglossus kowalevskii]
MAATSQEINENCLTCVICLDRYIKAKILPCQHSFCKQCLCDLLDSQDWRLQCPSCQQMYDIPSGSIDELPSSTFVNRLVDLIDEQEKQVSGEICRVCFKNCVMNRCIDCTIDLCALCAASHKMKPDMFDHQVLSTEEFIDCLTRDPSIAQPIGRCPSHNQRTDIYCRSCAISSCSKCAILIHRDHDLSDIQDAANDFRIKTRISLHDVKAKELDMQNRKRSAIEHSRSLLEEYTRQQVSVKTHFQRTMDAFYQELKDKEELVLSRLKSEYLQLDEKMKSEIGKLNTTEDQLSKTVICVDKILQYSNDSQLMTNSDEMTHRIGMVKLMFNNDMTVDNSDAKLPQFIPGELTLQGSFGTLNSDVDIGGNTDRLRDSLD